MSPDTVIQQIVFPQTVHIELDTTNGHTKARANYSVVDHVPPFLRVQAT